MTNEGTSPDILGTDEESCVDWKSTAEERLKEIERLQREYAEMEARCAAAIWLIPAETLAGDLQKLRDDFRRRLQPEPLPSKEQRLVAALEMMYDKWEDGTPCYEDADTTGVSLGNAFKLTAEEEAEILALIPEQRKQPHIGKTVTSPQEQLAVIHGMLVLGGNLCPAAQRVKTYLEEKYAQKSGVSGG